MIAKKTRSTTHLKIAKHVNRAPRRLARSRLTFRLAAYTFSHHQSPCLILKLEAAGAAEGALANAGAAALGALATAGAGALLFARVASLPCCFLSCSASALFLPACSNSCANSG